MVVSSEHLRLSKRWAWTYPRKVPTGAVGFDAIGVSQRPVALCLPTNGPLATLSQF